MSSPRARAVPLTSTGDLAVSPVVEVRTSTRRRKTAGARLEGGRIVVVVPAHWSAAVRDQVVADLVRRITRRRPAVTGSDEDLAARAAQLADRYLDGVRPTSVRWASNQSTRWGSCTTTTGAVRISDRLRAAPAWVLDAVLVHELAHLVEHDHTPRFRELEARYPRQADADHFLAGFSLGLRWREPGSPDDEDCTVQTV